ncbi:MAG: UDP-N-acetylmuramoyl-L-alanine--D-glutamate ligase [Bacillota bacterium]|jgi:UDP-N-acetylmuramoylalanine--D-glutamate ligase
MNIENANVIVLGAGRSGVSAVRFLLDKNCSVTLYDGSPAKKPVYDELAAAGCVIAAGERPEVKAGSYDFAVISPGIPLSDPLAAALKEAGIPVWGELELASRFITAPIIGITGTNGKTTTTTLIGEILKNDGFNVFVGGNIGVPLLDSVGGDYDYYVVEMSSFQLETIETLDAEVAVYLNLTPDHLDRHGDMAGYLDAKARLTEKQSPERFVVLNYDDEAIRSLHERTAATPFFFSRKSQLYFGATVRRNRERTIVFRLPDDDPWGRIVINADEIRLPGPHNLENALAAITACRLLNVPANVIADTLRTFTGVEHRLEDVLTLKGVRYVNDSKATNPDSVYKALDSFDDTPIVLIAGGRNKGNSFDVLGEYIREHCKELVLIGEAAADIAAGAEKAGFEKDRIHFADDMADAVARSAALAEDGDIVLLSPANASFDQFSSYEHRGEVFKDLVRALAKA